MRVALVSREVYPFIGGGLSRYVTATAETLAEIAEVKIFTTSRFEKRYRELRRSGSGDLPRGVEFVFVREPRRRDVGNFYHRLHVWSARACAALKEAYADAPPDLVEFPDYFGEGCVAIQARRTLDPILRDTCMCVRLYTTTELTSVLNGHVDQSFGTTMLYDLERYALRYADAILFGGGDVYAAYERYYGREHLAPPFEVIHPALRPPAPADADVGREEGAPLRLLYVGRMERRKGVQNLIRAVTGLIRDDWELTLVGGDTPTAPLGTSMTKSLKLAVDGDRRIRFRSAASPMHVAELLRAHDVAVFPSLWECWPNVALEAFAQNRPVLATPTGGFVGLVEPGRTGWLARGTDTASVRRAVTSLLDDREAVARVTESRAPLEAFARLTDRETVTARYRELVEAHRERLPRRRRRRGQTPLVSVVVPYYKLEPYVRDTIASVFAQTYTSLDVVVVNDGSFAAEDAAVLDELAAAYPLRVVTQQNAGLGAARNFGVAQSRGRYVFPLDADDLVAPTFVERCVDVLEADPEVAYVTSWLRFVDDAGTPLTTMPADYVPLGNMCNGLASLNVAGSAEAVFRKHLFHDGFVYSRELTSYEDWLHFRALARAGWYGHVIPEPLLSYRIRGDSMVRTVALFEHDRILGEMEAHLREQETTWTRKSA